MSTTQNPPATIDEQNLSVTRTVIITASPAKVWAAVTQPEHIARWHTTAATMSALEPGGVGHWTFEGEGDIPVEVVAVDPLRSVTYRWSDKAGARVNQVACTTFTFTLEPTGEGTQLTVVETGFEALDDPRQGLTNNQYGWTTQLDALASYLEDAS